MKELQEIRDVMNAMSQTLSGVSTGLPGATFPEGAPEETPMIKASRSTMDNVQSLFETLWGQRPRTVADVLKALEANAVPDTTTSVAVCLMRLVKRHVLRRTQKSGKWQYYKLPAG